MVCKNGIFFHWNYINLEIFNYMDQKCYTLFIKSLWKLWNDVAIQYKDHKQGQTTEKL